MHIAQVTAHFPPDFVSGGTLIPQRLARAVAEAGHESSVFAGALHGLEGLETRDDVQGDVAVRWVGVEPFIGWSLDENFDNPQMVKIFARWLDEAHPDVIHIHNLQGFGSTVIREAHQRGIRVVMTMHDFWWVCGRQFLVNRDMQPCTIVPGAGDCQCEVTSSWRTQRFERLKQDLEFVDVILTPSTPAAEVLIASGIPGDKVRVNENGIDVEDLDGASGPFPAWSALLRKPRPGRPTRFMFAGGTQEMKGYDVLREAVELADVPEGTTLTMFGSKPYAGKPEWVHPSEPYSHDALGDVFANHDVLILPSVMRESHSLLTREALLAGLAVICTDTLGPEAAIEHGVNGMIVPAADTHTLAEAISEMARPDVRETMMGRGSASPVRTPEQQTIEALTLYEELADDSAGEETPEEALEANLDGLLNRILIVVGIQGAPMRYRAYFAAEALETAGYTVTVRHYQDPRLIEDIEFVDAVLFYRVPATNQNLELIDAIRSRSRAIPILGDIDDLIFDPDIVDRIEGLSVLPPDEQELWIRGVRRYRTILEKVDLYTGSTPELCRQAERLLGVPARRFDNGIGKLLGVASDRALNKPRTPGPLRVGYFSGTDMHDADWAHIEDAVLTVLAEHPEVELWLGGKLKPTPAVESLGDRLVILPFVPWYELPTLLRDVDVCLSPLTPGSIFNESKSAIKWLEAALVKTPVIASPTEPFREAIDHGRTGYLASTPEEWHEYLHHLLTHHADRTRMGSAANRSALLRWSPARQGEVARENVLAALRQVLAHGSKVESAWESVYDDEPYAASPVWLEPYEIPHHSAVRKLLPAKLGRSLTRLSQLSARLMDVAKSEGMSVAVRKSGRALKRELDRLRN